MLEDYFEEEKEKKKKKKRNNNSSQPQNKQQQTMASKISTTVLPSVFFSRPKKGHSAPDVTWACAWCLVSRNITQTKICNISPFLNTVCHDKTPQTSCSSQNYESNELFTPHVI